MGIDARSGVIVPLVPGGAAEQDGLICVGDAVTAVDDIALVGKRLGKLLPSQTGASCELMLTRTDEAFTQQLRFLGLPLHLAYRLLRLQVRRSVAHGLGVAMQAALVRDITAATSELNIGDVVLKVDGKALGPGETLSSVLEVGRLAYTFIVARRLEEALPPVITPSDALVVSTEDIVEAPVSRNLGHVAQDSGPVLPTHASLAEELDTEEALAPAKGRTDEQNRKNRAGQSWLSAGLAEGRHVEAQVAKHAAGDMVVEDALQLDRLAQAAIEDDSDTEQGVPCGVDDEACTSDSVPCLPPLQQSSEGPDADAPVAATRVASQGQAVHCPLAPPPTKSRRDVVMPTVLLAPRRFPGAGVLSANAYNAGTGTWCDLPSSLRLGDAHGEEVVWSDLPTNACPGSAMCIKADGASHTHALWAMIEQVLSHRAVLV